MIHYVIQTIAFQLFFLLIYDLFLKRETFFNWNRLYLITTIVLSVLLPFVQLDSFRNVIPQEYIIQLPAVVLGEKSPSTTNVLNPMFYLYVLFYIGFVIAILMFVFKLFRIIKLVLVNPKTHSDKLIIVKLLNSNSAFSFFKYVFLGEFLKDDEKAHILSHEMVHVKQYHSLDLLFFEVLRILFWFNPLVYMYQNRITELHEFLADAEAVKYQSKNQYYQSLLAQVFQTRSISFINPFFNQSLIKKRIVMLQKSKSKHIKLLKYAFLIPAVIAMLVYTSCEKQQGVYEEGTAGFGQPNESKVPLYILDDRVISGEEAKAISPEDIERVEVFKNNKEYIEKYGYQAKDGVVKMSTKEGKSESDKNIIEDIEVPFGFVEEVPVFPGCESLESNEERKKCMAMAISKFVNENFNTDLANDLGLVGRQRINVIFKINENGDVVDVKARAPHPGLEEEAKRVVQLLPKMQPGKQKGHSVTVPYSLPIVFQVANKE